MKCLPSMCRLTTCQTVSQQQCVTDTQQRKHRPTPNKSSNRHKSSTLLPFQSFFNDLKVMWEIKSTMGWTVQLHITSSQSWAEPSCSAICFITRATVVMSQTLLRMEDRKTTWFYSARDTTIFGLLGYRHGRTLQSSQGGGEAGTLRIWNPQPFSASFCASSLSLFRLTVCCLGRHGQLVRDLELAFSSSTSSSPS